ncbi:hypothetical protein RRF57_010390 [Xylaria bambusicola]|uniref:Rhodopsin domain-containing protein n=1 Tax=Xylaria bambusicola TaxID=326684 RepID=A0AAN7USC0_9PEZI
MQDKLHDLPEWLQEIILNGPALAPPPGVKSNLDNPPNLNTLGIAVTTLCLAISTIVFALAAYAKLYCMRKVHIEDLISICVSCTPYYRIWDETAVGTCGANREIIYIAGAVGNLVSDVIITLLPQRVIWKLQVKTQKKIGIAFIFFVGLLTIIAGGFKVDASVHLYLDDDKTYQTSAVAVWAIAELTCVLLVYCVPSIPKIFKDSGISIRLPSSFVSWLRSGSTKTHSGAGSSLPSFEGKQIALSASRQSKLGADAAVE